MKKPKDRQDENDDTTEQQIDQTALEAVEDLDCFREWKRENRGDGLNFGDY